MGASASANGGWDTAASLRLHDAFGRIEEESNAFLDQSLSPRGSGMLYELVATLGFGPGAQVLDLGCGEGGHTVELARRFGFAVLGIDPIVRHIETAQAALIRAEAEDPGIGARVRFEVGDAEHLPLDDSSADLVWCRDVFELIPDIYAACAEMRRILRPDGRAVVYQTMAGDRLEPREAAWLFPTMACLPENMEREFIEGAIHASGLDVVECLDLGPEWGEYGQEQTGRGAQKMIRAARLIRAPERYIERFGRENYEIALGDCLWHIYRLIGKLRDVVFVLKRTDAGH